MGYLAYDVATHLLGLLALPFLPLLWWSRHGEGLSERLGRLPSAVSRLQRPIWIHAASVGEVLSARPLVVALRRRYPHSPILVSTTSVTGRATARAQLQPDAAMLLPLDLRWILVPVFRALRPTCLVIVETELWPNLLRVAANHGVPVAMVSGRISEVAASRYARVPWLTHAMLAHVDLLAMQSEQDAKRVRALGAAPEDLQVVGSLKYARLDHAAPAVPVSFAKLVEGRDVLLAASTHPGEEEFVVEACTELFSQHPQLLLAIAPRRPERFAAVVAWLENCGVRFERRTETGTGVQPTTQVLLIDTVGELLAFFPLCRAAFVGGTLVPVGGHNVTEPALFAKPVAFGPHTNNVADAARALLEARGAVRVHEAADLAMHWREVLDNPNFAIAMGERAQAVVRAQADVAERTLDLLAPLLDEAGR